MGQQHSTFTSQLAALGIVADTGTANAYVLSGYPNISSGGYQKGEFFVFIAANSNTAASTLNVNSRGTKAIVRAGGTALSGGEIASGQIVWLVYDGTNLQLMTGTTSGGVNVDNETVTFSGTSGTLANTPLPGSLTLYRNGLLMIPTTEYSIGGAAITLVTATSSGDVFIANYRK